MDHNTDTELTKSVDQVDGCVFPTGPDNQTCGRPVATNGKPGKRRSLYCDLPDHTRGKAFAVRRRYELAAARSNNSQHAVTQVEDEVVRTVSDPDAASYEVEQRKREAAIQIAEAQRLQVAAEHEASNARHQAAREAEQRAQADEAAEQALREVHQIQVDLAEARSAATRADVERESAQRAAEHDRATIQSLRQQLEQQHHDLDILRQQAQEERAALAQHYTDQIAAMLATLKQVSGHTQSKPAIPKTNTTTQTARKNKSG
jgi:colicin import membrane protein